MSGFADWWDVRDVFGVAWRLRVVADELGPQAEASAEAELRAMRTLLYYGLDPSGEGDERLLRALVDVHDRLTGDAFASGAPRSDVEFRGLPRRSELTRVLCDAVAARRLRVEELRPPPWPFMEVEPTDAPSPPSVREERTAFVALRLMDQDGHPVPRRGVHVSLADRSSRSGFFDDQGAFRLDDVPEGTCVVTLDDLDRRELSPPAPLPGTERDDAVGPVCADAQPDARVHVVAPGDTLSSIAERFGFMHYAVVWNHPANAGLRAARGSPHVLLAGDEVVVPDKRPFTLSVSTNTVTTLTVYIETLRVRVRALDVAGEPVDIDPAGVRVDGNEVTASCTIDVLDAPVPREATRLSSGRRDAPGAAPAWDAVIGALPPLRESGGVEARLENLGFGTFDDVSADGGDPDDRDAEEARELAIELFRESLGKTPASELADQDYADLRARAGA